MEHLRGLPKLSLMRRTKVRIANFLADFTWDCMHIIQEVQGMAVAEFPEDLGAVARGEWEGVRPGSLWQWPACKELWAKDGAYTAFVSRTLALTT